MQRLSMLSRLTAVIAFATLFAAGGLSARPAATATPEPATHVLVIPMSFGIFTCTVVIRGLERPRYSVILV